MTLTPEQLARQKIDAMLATAGWIVQDRPQMNLSAGRGVAVREFVLAPGHGFADYLLFVDGEAVGVLEAKPPGFTLSGVETQAAKYSTGIPAGVDPPVTPLPFLYLATGEEIRFTNGLDPDPKSRRVFSVPRPETLSEWISASTLDTWTKDWAAPAAEGRPSSLRSRVQLLPPLPRAFLYANQVEAITKLEESLKKDKPRALIQMATGSGKTIMAVTSIYRLIKFGGARRVLFLVDRTNLGEQAETAFQGYRTPDDNRMFSELYKVQRLASNTIASSTKVAITTVQRLYSMLKGEPDFDPALEEGSVFVSADPLLKEPLPVVYNPAYPPEFFDVIFVDECHRSIYSLWRQVLEYFDAFLVGLTATPAKHTFGFFNQNLVMEYPHARAVADGVNVDFEVYRIRTQITESGSTIDVKEGTTIGFRNRRTRKLRWEIPDAPVTYSGGDLDRSVVAKDQIRLIVRTFKERLFTELFPGRKEIPKTIVFAKDDSHAEDIVEILREEFGRGNSFCQKITYKTTAKKPADLIQEFRNSFDPRIAVTVDMIATGTDIRPVEIVIFFRSVQSRVLFEQMKGRGVRIIDTTELQSVTPDAPAKTHFVIVDAVGVSESCGGDSEPLEKKKSVPLKSLLEHIAMGGTDPEVISSLASRLSRLEKQLGDEQLENVKTASGGAALSTITEAFVEALDADKQTEKARELFVVQEGQEPTDEQLDQAEKVLIKEASKPLASNPGLRSLVLDLKVHLEQTIDEVSKDRLLFAGMSDEAKTKAQTIVTFFEAFLKENKEEIDALQFFFSQPYTKRLRYADIKALADAIKAPPHSWTPDVLWRAYEMLERDRVRGASSRRMLTDVVSLVRFALHQEDELVPYPEKVRERFQNWLGQQSNNGRQFTPDQLRWLEMIRDHVATSLEIDVEDFDLTPFAEEGGLGGARQVFGKELGGLLKELNEVLAA